MSADVDWGVDVKRSVTMTVNGTQHTADVEPRLNLVDFLRIDLGLTGTHIGCEHGVCGACTVLLEGEPIRSCLFFAIQADGTTITTIEALAVDDQLHPIQEAFHENHGLQCGFCTPGMVLAALAFLEDNPSPSEREIRVALAGNLCMCTGYVNIVKSVQAAAAALAGKAGT
ncbi:MAG: carbon monoxide dehydrogenase small chain [Chloroflexi bacterium]|nr:carbon monoxide dehydrogenase small chain [Chloroflexota bacterium]